jgi:hypothetical protein
MIGTMTQDTKDRIAEMERQKIALGILGQFGKDAPNRGGNLRDRRHHP